MTAGSRVLVPAALLFVATTVAAWSPSARATVDSPAPGTPTRYVHATGAEGYVGSQACQRCHDAQYDQWNRSLHVRMTRPVAEALIVGDFTPGTTFAAHGRSYQIDTKDGRRFITVREGDGAPAKYEVLYSLGARRFQGYLTRLEGGLLFVLPAMWSIEQRRWVDWKEITPVPEGEHGLKQIWNVACFNCHATNLVQGYDVASRSYSTTWTEMGIACEACHGPGRAHIAQEGAWEKDPSTKPAFDASASNRDLSSVLRIFSPRTASPRAVYDACAYCHGNKQNRFVGFAPGDRYEDFALPFLVSEPMPPNDRQGEFWPDGRPSRFNRSQALAMSGCFAKAPIACTNCHNAHGSRNPNSLKVDITRGANGDLLCTQCHRELTMTALGKRVSALEGTGLEQHTHHPAASEGSRCINCHMSAVNWRLLVRRRDHTFAPPVPEMTGAYGTPNACTTCHEDRTPEWAARTLDAWYGNGERRTQVMQRAETLYLAGAGDVAALPRLAALALDRQASFVLRASAVQFIGRLVNDNRAGGPAVAADTARSGPSQTAIQGSPATVAASTVTRTLTPKEVDGAIGLLIGAAADPEPTVRAMAVRALGLFREPRSLMPLIARLSDQARVVRAAAAEALLYQGVTELTGAAGPVLARAQDELVEALRSFPDAADNHASLAWLESLRGRHDEAAREAAVAVDVSPGYARAHVFRGLVAARAGRFDEALAAWKTAKKLAPDFPNLERMIAEGEKRRGKP